MAECPRGATNSPEDHGRARWKPGEQWPELFHGLSSETVSGHGNRDHHLLYLMSAASLQLLWYFARPEPSKKSFYDVYAEYEKAGFVAQFGSNGNDVKYPVGVDLLWALIKLRGS